MAHDTGHKIKANELQLELTVAEQKIFLLQSRLELVADIMIKHGFIQNTPHARYSFVNGAPVSSFFPIKEGAEYTDLDGLSSNS